MVSLHEHAHCIGAGHSLEEALDAVQQQPRYQQGPRNRSSCWEQSTRSYQTPICGFSPCPRYSAHQSSILRVKLSSPSRCGTSSTYSGCRTKSRVPICQTLCGKVSGFLLLPDRISDCQSKSSLFPKGRRRLVFLAPGTFAAAGYRLFRLAAGSLPTMGELGSRQDCARSLGVKAAAGH